MNRITKRLMFRSVLATWTVAGLLSWGAQAWAQAAPAPAPAAKPTVAAPAPAPAAKPTVAAPAAKPAVAPSTTPPAAAKPGPKPAAAAPSASKPAGDAEFPGLNADELMPSAKDGLRRLLQKFQSPCGKPHSLLTSLKTDATCKISPVAARWMVKLFTDGFLESEVEERYTKRFVSSKCVQIDTSGAQALGDAAAPISLIEFSDFECPHCRMAEPIVKQVLKEFKNVRWVFMNFPLQMHVNAPTFAAAALAAGKQGKFWQFHDKLFENQGTVRQADLILYAQELGLDVRRFQADIEAMRSRVARERAIGEKLDLGGTPTFYVNCRKVEGPLSLDNLRSYIEAEAAK
ncbi:MAG: thioredoxin domain-containing protein [Myxococcales bacterium]|nr:thioredoxin domain-containing protein [Myxococcales bacterium]